MHSVSLLLAALVGAASAEPALNWPRYYGSWVPSGASSSSRSAPSLSSLASSTTSVRPISTGTTASSIAAYSSGGYHPSSPSSSSLPYIPWSSPVVSTGTETLTTYTTVTVCPVTQTSGTQVITTLTTSTITITSCKGGCHHQLTTPSTPHSTGLSSIVYPTTITTSAPIFVPTSLAVSSQGATTYYSTWLSASYTTKIYSTKVTVWQTGTAQPSLAASTPVGVAAVTSTALASGTCPAPTTVYSTVYVTVAPQVPPKECHTCYETHTYTESGTTTTVTFTKYPEATTTPSSAAVQISTQLSVNGYSSKSVGTGYSSKPTSTGASSVPYAYFSSSSTWMPASSRIGPKPTGGYNW
jgi:hypothetical protein